MADLPATGFITANNDYDVKLPSDRSEVIIAGDTSGTNEGFDGGTIDIKAVHPVDGTTTVENGKLTAPVVDGTGITSDFTRIYRGQKGLKIRFTLSNAGANTRIAIHVGAADNG